MVLTSGAPFGPVESAAVSEVLASGLLWRGNGPSWRGPQGSNNGAVADRLEDAFGQRLGLPFVHAVNSGTSANEAAVASLGLEPGDEVICPAASPIFVPFSVLAVGCIPVFADVDSETLLLDPDGIGSVVSEKTRAVVAVHLWGTPAPMEEILKEAGTCGLKVIEDCAQAFGTAIDGQLVGTFGDASCFSLQQSKHISSGEGGIFATRSAEGYARAVLYSNAGIPSFRYGISASEISPGPAPPGHLGFGHNHRISELQAAVALAQLSRIDEFITRRSDLVKVVDSELLRRGNPSVRVAGEWPGCTVSYWKYPVLVPPGRGTYVGIPHLEPVFQQMDERRSTPFGVPIPPYVDYGRGAYPGARAGAAQIRVVSVQHALSDQEVLDDVNRLFEDL